MTIDISKRNLLSFSTTNENTTIKTLGFFKLDMLPVSENKRLMKSNRSNKFMLSDEYRESKEYIQQVAHISDKDYYANKDKVRIKIVFKLNKNKRDIDNGIKIILDALQTIWYNNDNQVLRLIVEKNIDKYRKKETCVVSGTAIVDKDT